MINRPFQSPFTTVTQITGKEVVFFNSKEEFENDLYNNSVEYLCGLGIMTSGQSSLIGLLHFNNTLEDADVALAEIIAMLSKVLFKNAGIVPEIKYMYLPLNAGISLTQMWGYFGPLIMGFALINIASSFASILVSDKENARIHSMSTSGLYLSSYFVANFVFDFLAYAIINIICWIVLYLFNTDAIVKNNWMATLLPFVFVAFQNLAMVYMFAMFFDRSKSVNAFMLSITIIIVLVPYCIVTLFMNNMYSDTTGLFLSIIPSFSIQFALTKASNHASGLPYSAKDVWSSEITKLFGVQIAVGIIFIILAIIIYYVKLLVAKMHKKGKNHEEVDGIIQVDENAQKMERDVIENGNKNAAITLKNLTRYFTDAHGQEFKAVDNLTMYVKTGDLFGILGANGAGKTTLMSIITGQIPQSSGTINLFGHDIKKCSDAHPFVSICPQFDNHLFPLLTPREHFMLYGQLMGYNKEKIQQKIDEYMDLMALGQYSDRQVRKLSGGNKRKLAICLAFLGEAPIIFLDEPTASLDPISRIQVQKLIKLKLKEKTILLCTHLLAEAESLCDKIAMMFSGKILAYGTPQELSQKYGRKWKVELGLKEESEEVRTMVDNFMKSHFKNAQLAGTRYATASYNIPKEDVKLSEVFMILNENQDKKGYSYFTCSMYALERVFIDLVIQHES